MAGRLGEAATLRIGAVVAEGEKLGAVVPVGIVRVVAEFSPEALGRIRAGQPGRLRLHAFPWAQYGSVPLTVSSAGNELGDGRVRVELSVDPRTPSQIPIQHGLPGSVEIEVERVRIVSNPSGAGPWSAPGPPAGPSARPRPRELPRL